MANLDFLIDNNEKYRKGGKISFIIYTNMKAKEVIVKYNITHRTLGKNKLEADVMNNNYKSYDEVKEYIKNLKIKNQRDYFTWIKGKSIKLGIPSGPRKFYKNDWKGWDDFLGKNRQYYSYEECCKLIISNNILSKSGYNNFRRSSKDLKIPSNPEKHFKEWSWDYFFKKKIRNFLKFEDAREYAHTLKIKSNKKWVEWINSNNIDFLPTYPNNFYKEWISWSDWLDNKKIISYEDAKVYLSDKNINTIKDYHIWYDLNKINFLPKIPHKYYKEFISYKDYLSYNLDYSKFIKYNEAKKYIIKFNIRTQREYKIWQKSNNISFLPNWPDGVYDEWISWNDYLSIDKKHSSGENIIENILIKMNINHIKQKRFSDCRNKLPLPFDFYLPDINTCIEYDGEQHFKEINVFGGDDRFKNQKINDNIKNIYCLEKNINLVRIPYWDILNIESILKNRIEYGII